VEWTFTVRIFFQIPFPYASEDRRMKKHLLILISLAFFVSCSSTTVDKLTIQVHRRNGDIKRLRALNERLERKIVELSVLNKKLTLKIHTVSDQDIDKAFKIVNDFFKADENADSNENYEFIGRLVENIDPVNTERKVQLLLDICSEYTPTDYIYLGTACNKLLLYGELLFPNAEEELILSKESPLLGSYKN
jgi:hypothetical protein